MLRETVGDGAEGVDVDLQVAERNLRLRADEEVSRATEQLDGALGWQLHVMISLSNDGGHLRETPRTGVRRAGRRNELG